MAKVETADPPLVSIITVNYNGKHHLKECIESVMAQSYPNIELIVVDNASKDGSVEYVTENFPKVKVVQSGRNGGLGAGNNLGGKNSRGEFVVLLNNDTRLDPEAISILMQARLDYPAYDIFMGFALNYADPSIADSAGDTYYWVGAPFSFTGYPAARFTRPRRVPFASTTLAMVSRELLDRVGWFDEDLFLTFEDTDLSLRARHAGADILFVPAAKVFHKGSASMGGRKSPASFLFFDCNYQLVILKNFPLPALILFIPGLIFTKALRLFFSIKHGCFMGFLRGNMRSLALLPRFLAKRGPILRDSKLSTRMLISFFRRNWYSERRAFHAGIYDAPE